MIKPKAVLKLYFYFHSLYYYAYEVMLHVSNQFHILVCIVVVKKKNFKILDCSQHNRQERPESHTMLTKTRAIYKTKPCKQYGLHVSAL